MQDAMLSELYHRAFKTKEEAESLDPYPNEEQEAFDRRRGVASALNNMLGELISLRTDQLRLGRD